MVGGGEALWWSGEHTVIYTVIYSGGITWGGGGINKIGLHRGSALSCCPTMRNPESLS